jgi:UDP-2-acetamido-2-deoxy-ribo-hexuluronate aminotransferase
LRQRFAIGNCYNELFGNKIRRVRQRPDRTSVFAQYTIMVEDRKTVQAHLKELGIPTAVHYPVPIPRQPAYARYDDGLDLPVCNAMSQTVMSLPMGPYMDTASVERVAQAVLQAVAPG